MLLKAKEEKAQPSEYNVAVYTRGKSTSDPVYVNLSKLYSLVHLNVNDAAKCMGLSPTAFKNACRKLGVHEWPYRNIKKMERRRLIAQLQRKKKRDEKKKHK
eukprot:3937466-Rhodomonas_salina.2